MGILGVDNIVFSLGGQGVSLIQLISVLLGLINVFLAGRASKYNFWVGYIYAISLFLLFMQKGLYSSMLLQPLSLALSIYGHWKWTHPNKNESNKKKELKVSSIQNKKKFIIVFSVIGAMLIWGTLMKFFSAQWPDLFPPARLPYLDALVSCAIVTAQILSAKKRVECWYAWIFVNITNTTLYISAGLLFMPIVSLSFLTMAFMGLKTWKKQLKNQDDE